MAARRWVAKAAAREIIAGVAHRGLNVVNKVWLTDRRRRRMAPNG